MKRIENDSLTIYFNFYDFVKTQIENSKCEAKNIVMIYVPVN